MRCFLFMLLLFSAGAIQAQPATFSFDSSGFYLNQKAFNLRCGEMHFQRIPRAYWRDRLLKARAMGLNTVATYVFWNALEPKPGQWDFSGNNDLAAFIRTAGEVGLYVFVRPGPYACAEWDLGGLPSWLLATPDIQLRSSDPRYLEPALKYFKKIAGIVRPLQIDKGGPVIMVQVENEYGSYSNDRRYLETLRTALRKNGITVPLSTSDGATPYMLEAGSLPGCVTGLDPGANASDFAQAQRSNPGSPAWCSELYPGWLTHWGEEWARADTTEILKDLRWLLENGKSFSLYVVHGGTNWGWYAGANTDGNGVYQPDLTSYDYDAPIREDGTLTPKYWAIRRLLQQHQGQGQTLPLPPESTPLQALPDIRMAPLCSVLDALPAPVTAVQPRTMEQLGQTGGFLLYRTQLLGHHSGRLTVTDVHDYANVYVDGRYVGTLDRTKKVNTLQIPAGDTPAKTLDILVEGMGRVNFGQYLHDRKGITARVTLNGATLLNWQMFSLPMDAEYIAGLRQKAVGTPQPGLFFLGEFEVKTPADTYLDLAAWEKGVVWVNGHNLGRYWNRGPQTRLYLPATLLRTGKNEVVIFDMHRTEAAVLRGATALEP